MANNPITQSLPADLPVNWTYGQTVAPTGAEAGLSEQHGYNYLMEQVNAAQRAASEIGEAFGNLSPSDIGAASDDVVTEIQNNLTSHESDTAVHLRQLTCTKSGNVFQLTGLSGATGLVSCTFKAPSDYVSGNTFTVGGTAYTIQLSNGDTPANKMFVSGAVLSIILDTVNKKINFKSGGLVRTLITETIEATKNWTNPSYNDRPVMVTVVGAGGGGYDDYGGNGASVASGTFSLAKGEVVKVTIAAATSGAGGASSFGTYLSASGGARGSSTKYGVGANNGGAPGGNRYNMPGEYGGNGGKVVSTSATGLKGTAGTRTIGMGLEFEGTGAAGLGGSAGSASTKAGGYGGNGGSGGYGGPGGKGGNGGTGGITAAGGDGGSGGGGGYGGVGGDGGTGGPGNNKVGGSSSDIGGSGGHGGGGGYGAAGGKGGNGGNGPMADTTGYGAGGKGGNGGGGGYGPGGKGGNGGTGGGRITVNSSGYGGAGGNGGYGAGGGGGGSKVGSPISYSGGDGDGSPGRGGPGLVIVQYWGFA